MMRTLLGVLITFLVICKPVFAGVIDVIVDPGGTAAIGVKYKNDGEVIQTIFDRDGDGAIRFTIPEQEDVDIGVIITEYKGKELIINIADLGIGGLTGLEPFAIPTFSDTETGLNLVPLFNTEAFLSEGLTLNIGDTVEVSNSDASTTPNIRFFDGSLLPSDRVLAAGLLLDTDYVKSLPYFSGKAQVESLIHFQVPEPSSTVLTGMCLSLIFLLRLLNRTTRQESQRRTPLPAL
ncbi:hypothetical protein EUZ85_27470 [Hahella sp. KA22]|uniref:hypothetical protein n=1 Tax=Hahella sp. KA22 TaxID=1628392 RepID=UPI000FDEFD19|nr:hypothetical protein [Hahella sp. KA22]AZZ94258.1 hypothetical protein ENC22_24885 [Hahella sp. KA22]QAY57632.1 hypothetical protein EUZ85_27470 [Hahella sp. KA22]